MLHNHLQCLLGKVILVLHAVFPAAPGSKYLLHNWLLHATHCKAKIAGAYMRSNEMRQGGTNRIGHSWSAAIANAYQSPQVWELHQQSL